jgi:hypothetical protein
MPIHFFHREPAMQRTIRILCLAVIATTLIASHALGQAKKGRGGGIGGFGGGDSLASLATREPVQKDLGVSGDLATKLASLRDDFIAAQQKEYQSAGISFQNFQNMSAEERQKMRDKIVDATKKLNEEFIPKIKALVSADQYKRLQQIHLQSNLRFRGPGALTYADVASELKLSDEQKMKLDALQTEYDAKQRELFTGGAFDPAASAKLADERTSKTLELLTAEQKEKLNSLKGPAFDVSQIPPGGGRRGKGN